MSYFYLYRINGGEVLGVSTSDSWEHDAYKDVYESETVYALSPPKWCDGETLRAATEQEITNFPVAASEDEAAQEKQEAEDILSGSTGTDGCCRLHRATVETLRVEINTLRELLDLDEYTEQAFKALIVANL
jgi:hypothetical protein